jgi:spore cortex formation protein SpoVR/YcgB (stage V sporulation)
MIKKIAKPLSKGPEWTFELLGAYQYEIDRIAKNFGLDTFPNQIEIISSEQMMDVYASVGMPVGYHHWSFGKQFVTIEKQYKKGEIGLAYELIINSNPAIAYLLEENTMPMQALVIAHACYGHNSFFKGNYLFKLWTSPDSIVDYLVFARNYIAECEEKYGAETVEALLDACHALMNNGVFRYKHPHSLSLHEEKIRQRNREQYLQSQVNELWRTMPHSKKSENKSAKKNFPEESQENILYFIEKHAPLLEPWQREIIRIIRKMAQYFYPQRQTKVMNEGWATFWHYTIMNQLYDEKLVSDEFMLEVLHSHTSVIAQPSFNSPHFYGINPYTLGFNIYEFIEAALFIEFLSDENKKHSSLSYFSNFVGLRQSLSSRFHPIHTKTELEEYYLLLISQKISDTSPHEALEFLYKDNNLSDKMFLCLCKISENQFKKNVADPLKKMVNSFFGYISYARLNPVPRNEALTYLSISLFLMTLRSLVSIMSNRSTEQNTPKQVSYFDYIILAASLALIAMSHRNYFPRQLQSLFFKKPDAVVKKENIENIEKTETEQSIGLTHTLP